MAAHVAPRHRCSLADACSTIPSGDGQGFHIEEFYVVVRTLVCPHPTRHGDPDFLLAKSLGQHPIEVPSHHVQWGTIQGPLHKRAATGRRRFRHCGPLTNRCGYTERRIRNGVHHQCFIGHALAALLTGGRQGHRVAAFIWRPKIEDSARGSLRTRSQVHTPLDLKRQPIRIHTAVCPLDSCPCAHLNRSGQTRNGFGMYRDWHARRDRAKPRADERARQGERPWNRGQRCRIHPTDDRQGHAVELPVTKISRRANQIHGHGLVLTHRSRQVEIGVQQGIH